MNDRTATTIRFQLRALTALLVLAASTTGIAVAQQTASKGTAAADLERTFWACDYAATKGEITIDMVSCGENYEAFKKARFGGNADKLFAYWRERKGAEHLALSTQHGLARVDSAVSTTGSTTK